MYGLRQPKPRVSQSLSLPAPTGGLNDLDPIAAMDPQFLIDSMNFFPDTATLNVRSGYQEWVTGIGNGGDGFPVKTIMIYDRLDGAQIQFACTDDGVYDTRTSQHAPPIALGVTNGLMVDTNFSTTAGQFLVFCNGQGTWHYNGTSFVPWTLVTTPAAPGEIKGVNPNTFKYVLVHKGRLWFLQNNSLTAWYLPIDSIGGEAKPFFLGGLFRRGGYLRALARWSMDTGSGLDDRLVFISSTGEIASYSGNDPSNAADWQLDATYYIGPLLSNRSLCDFGGDILYLSRRGLVPLSTLVQGSATEVLFSSVLSRRISKTVIRLSAQFAPPFVTEVSFLPDAAIIAINIWDPGTQKPVQLVLNFLSGAWGKFDYPVITIRAAASGNVYMGTSDGRVLRITNGQYTDNVLRDGSGGEPISAYLSSAFTYLEDPTANKHAKFIRPIFQTDVKPSFRTRVVPDFRVDQFFGTPVPNPARGNARWDLSRWDLAQWASTENVYRPWVSANVLGYSFAWQMNVSTSSFLGVAGIQWVWEAGGLI